MLRDLVSNVQSMTESAYPVVPVQAHTFYGSFEEAAREFNVMIHEDMSESASDKAIQDEFLLEAAASNDPIRFFQINENVFSNAIDAIKKFFKNIVAFIKGIIDKIKVTIVSHTNNVTQWEKIVLPKVEKRLNDSKAKDVFTYTGYDWKNNCAKIADLGDKTGDVGDLKTTLNDLKTVFKTAKDATKTNEYPGTSMDKDGNINRPELDDAAKDKLKKEHLDNLAPEGIDVTLSVDKNKEKITDHIMKTFYNGEKDINAYLTKYVKDEVRSTDKVEITKFGKVAPTVMIDFIKKSKDTLEAISTAYDKLKDGYDACVSILEGIDLDTEYDSKLSSQARANKNTELGYIKDALELRKHDVSVRQNAVNAIFAKKKTLVQEATKEFMVVLGSFATYKVAK